MRRIKSPYTKAQDVSIHAPVWGATPIYRADATHQGRFNPRTRVGCDRQPATKHALYLFQSTHPCGVRPPIYANQHGHVGFNPRTRVGCDNGRVYRTTDVMVSIHAPVWGATDDLEMAKQADAVSIHAPVWGATAAA